MADVITYCEDTIALLAEIQVKHPNLFHQDEETGEESIVGVDRTPTVRNGEKTLALVRNPPEGIYSLDSLEVLGTYDEVFADPAKLAKYDAVYNRSPRTWTDPGTAIEHTTTPPDRFGVFTA